MFIRTIVFVSYLIYIISLLIRSNQGFIISMIFTIIGTIVALLLVFLNISEIINEENIVDYLKNKTKRLFASFLLVAFFYIFSFARIYPYTIWRADYEGFQLTVKNIVLLNLSSRHVSSFMVFSILDTIFLFVTIISKHIIFKNYNLVNND